MPDQAGPTVAVILVTYTDDPDGPRAQYAHKALASIDEYIRYSGTVRLHIADDGSPQAHRDALAAVVGDAGPLITMTNAARGGYGASINLASQVVHPLVDYVLTVEDDWELLREFNLDRLVRDLEAAPDLHCIRLGYIGITQGIYGELRAGADGDVYFVFDPASPDQYIWTGHPRLERVAHLRKVGPWPEGLSPGATELAMCGRPAAREGVAWPMDLCTPRGNLFAHIGTVPASREHDR